MTHRQEGPAAWCRGEPSKDLSLAEKSLENKIPAHERQPRTCAKVAAERQAARIHAYWQERGIEVVVWIEPSDRRSDWAIPSTLLVRGRP
jgi:hypothetical protein